MCNKRKYDKIGALFALSTCKAKHNWNRKEIRIYYCNECKCWHLTSKNKIK